MSVITLVWMPGAAGLFARAIAQSGAAQAAAAPADAALVTAELGRALAVAKTGPSGPGLTATELARVKLPALIAAQAAVRDALAARPDPARFGPSIVVSTMAFIPVIDGDSLPEHPLASIAAGSGSEVPLLIRTNNDEFRTFLVPSGMADVITDEVLASMAGGVGGRQGGDRGCPDPPGGALPRGLSAPPPAH